MVAAGVEIEDWGNSFFVCRLTRDLSEFRNFLQETQRKLWVNWAATAHNEHGELSDEKEST